MIRKLTRYVQNVKHPPLFSFDLSHGRTPTQIALNLQLTYETPSCPPSKPTRPPYHSQSFLIISLKAIIRTIMTSQSPPVGISRGRFPALDALADSLRMRGADLSTEDMALSLQQIGEAERARNPLRTPFNLIVLAGLQAASEAIQSQYEDNHARWQESTSEYNAHAASLPSWKRQLYLLRHEPPVEPRNPNGWVWEDELDLARTRYSELKHALRILNDAGLVEYGGPRGYEDYNCAFKPTTLGSELLQMEKQPEFLPIPGKAA